ncbi:MAG: hypothetical protein LBU87_05790 [Lactobacillales bacterium]|nr:hypothetical protein [Lactobacillales bacterium]
MKNGTVVINMRPFEIKRDIKENDGKEVFEKLDQLGSPNAVDTSGKPVLFYAIHAQSYLVLRKFQEIGTNFSQTDSDGNNLAHAILSQVHTDRDLYPEMADEIPDDLFRQKNKQGMDPFSMLIKKAVDEELIPLGQKRLTNFHPVFDTINALLKESRLCRESLDTLTPELELFLQCVADTSAFRNHAKWAVYFEKPDLLIKEGLFSYGRSRIKPSELKKVYDKMNADPNYLQELKNCRAGRSSGGVRRL